jgi:general secretion pathway protein E
VKILTVEDPVEYQMVGINQIQVKPQIDLTFANALRSIVRQDPDVIMIGEIRDLETAQIAVQSALTGHLVLRPCTPTTRRRRSTACSTWAWRITCSRRR